MVCCVRNKEVAIKKWNKAVFDRVQDNIRDIRNSIAVLQESPQNDALLHKERDLQVQLDDLLKKEEYLWKEKSKEKWMEDGDHNTMIGRRYNHIASIQNGEHTTTTSFETIWEVFKDYFGKLFTSNEPEFPDEFEGLFPKSLSNLDYADLEDIPSSDEIRGIVFSMSNGKSPGPDGLSLLFYKFYCDIIHAKVVKAVQLFFLNDYLIRPLNHTYITLIPKKDNPNLVEHYRPISLCNVVYKIILKILANRIKLLLGKIISPYQSAFILGRTMNDNVITYHEFMHHINRKKGSLNLMAVKINLAKAYDKVEWAVLKKIMQLHGFPMKFINLIMECISMASFSILINGSPFDRFQSSRGLQQGDPLSSALFVIFIDLLSRLLLRAEAHVDLHGVKIGQCHPPVSHLLYADDATIFWRAEEDEVGRLVGILRKFSEWLG